MVSCYKFAINALDMNIIKKDVEVKLSFCILKRDCTVITS